MGLLTFVRSILGFSSAKSSSKPAPRRHPGKKQASSGGQPRGTTSQHATRSSTTGGRFVKVAKKSGHGEQKEHSSTGSKRSHPHGQRRRPQGAGAVAHSTQTPTS